MNNDWIEVYSTNDIFKAEVIKNMLISNNIEAIIFNQQDSSYHFGTAKIYTKKENILKAKEIISE
jgi:nitrate reductase alpha subunit